MAIFCAVVWVIVNGPAPTEGGAAPFGLYEGLSIFFAAAAVVLAAVSMRLNASGTSAQTGLNAAQNSLNVAQRALNACEARKHQLETENKKLQAKIETLRNYARNTPRIEYVYQDIVLFGPRNAGKTSAAELWTKPWTDIDGMPHTKQWKPYEATIFPLGSERRRDATFDVERYYERVLRVRIHDYPGEDEFRRIAIKELPQIESDSVLLLFFDLETDGKGITNHNKNNQYYSKAFFDSIEDQKGLTSKLAKVIVVFNKIDLLPSDWDPDQLSKALRSTNEDADRRIKSLFSGMLEYHFVSALTNQGLISLLGAAASAGLPAEAKKRFEEHLAKLYAKGIRY